MNGNNLFHNKWKFTTYLIQWTDFRFLSRIKISKIYKRRLIIWDEKNPELVIINSSFSECHFRYFESRRALPARKTPLLFVVVYITDGVNEYSQSVSTSHSKNIHSFRSFRESFFVKMSLCDQQWKPVIYLLALSMILSKYSLIYLIWHFTK